MQELEKILEEIDETIERYGGNPGLTGSDIADFCYGMNRVKDIIRKHMSGKDTGVHTNDGWIPVEDRLPTMKEYQKDDGRFILDDGNRRCAGYFDVYTGRFYSYRHITPYRAELYEDNRIIAWRPLPDPYQPERRADNE